MIYMQHFDTQIDKNEIRKKLINDLEQINNIKLAI